MLMSDSAQANFVPLYSEKPSADASNECEPITGRTKGGGSDSFARYAGSLTTLASFSMLSSDESALYPTIASKGVERCHGRFVTSRDSSKTPEL